MKCRAGFLVIGSLVVALLSLGTVQARGQDGSIVAWGWNEYGQCDVPAPNTDFVATSAGGGHTMGLKANGSIVVWGYNGYGECDVPSPNADFVTISAGRDYCLGIKSDGTIVAWGDNSSGQCDVPSPNADFVAVAGGYAQSLGLKSDGTIVGWGSNSNGQLNVPPPNADFVAASAGSYHSLGLKSNGTIVAWGANYAGQCNVPMPNASFVAVAAGHEHSLGLKSDGTIVAWGSNYYGQCNVPAPNAGFGAVAAGYFHNLGLKIDGTMVGWGENGYHQCNVPPPNADFVGVAAGHRHSVGLKGQAPTPVLLGEATAEVRDCDVRLRWRTPVDLTSVSFHVYRTGEERVSPDVGDRLTTEPLTSWDGTYEFVDATVRSNHDYEYRLEMLGDGSAPAVVRTLPVHVGRLRWRFGISAVRPHPVSGPATIALEITEKGHVSLDLIDVGGRRVQRLVDTEMDEGAHEVAFDPRRAEASGRPLPVGVYYAVLRFNGSSEGSRIIVIR